MRTIDALAGSKQAFLGLSDRELLRDGLAKFLPDGSVRWLEIGVGDGANLRYLLRQLYNGHRFHVLAVDPEVPEISIKTGCYSFEFRRVGIEGLQLESNSFECINARQSVYYFNNPDGTIAALVDALCVSGVLAITVWNEECILYKFHKFLSRFVNFPEGGVLPHGIARAAMNSGATLQSVSTFEAPLNMQAILRDPATAESFVSLARRSLPLPPSVIRQSGALVNEFLDEARPDAVRRNEVMFFSKA